jgi:hypothetical protein
MIICNKCNLEKENNEYYKNRRICKSCILYKQNEISKNDYNENKEYYIHKSKVRYNKLKESLKEYGNIYYHNIYKIKKLNNNINKSDEFRE